TTPYHIEGKLLCVTANWAGPYIGSKAARAISASRHRMSALRRGFNRSTQHLLILLDWEVSDGGECTDVVHAETAGRALGAMEERSMCGGHRPSAVISGRGAQGHPPMHVRFAPLKADKAQSVGMLALCHVWTAPSWQGLSSRLQVGRCSHVFGLFVRFT